MKKILLLTITICLSSISFGQVPSYVPTNGLVGWWGFNGNANDDSGNGNNGTVNGAILTSDRFGNTNAAYDFDGQDDYISGASSGSLNVVNTQQLSMSCWINVENLPPILPNNTGGSARIFTLSNQVGTITNQQYGIMGTNDGGIYWLAHGPAGFESNGHNATNQPLYSTGTWEYLTMTYDGDSIKLYHNASLVFIKQETDYFVSGPTGFFTISSTTLNPIATFDGKIDDIGIWNRALDTCEILNLYNASLGCGCSPTTATDTQSACDSYTWIDGNTYTASNNTATYTLTNAAGCDSVVTLDLTINSATVDAGNYQTVCLGCADIPDDSATLVATGAQSYSWDNGVTNGVAFLPSTTSLYTVTGTDANGCTATDTVTVFVGTRHCASFTLTGLDSVVFNSQTYYQTTLDTIVHTNISGCDSIEYLDIIINHTGINENILKDVEVYPNPTSDIITLKGISSLYDVSYIHLLDNKGALLRKIGINETQVDLSSFSAGIYFIEINHQLGNVRVKVVKQ